MDFRYFVHVITIIANTFQLGEMCIVENTSATQSSMGVLTLSGWFMIRHSHQFVSAVDVVIFFPLESWVKKLTNLFLHAVLVIEGGCIPLLHNDNKCNNYDLIKDKLDKD
jgi:hypothetical protein